MNSLTIVTASILAGAVCGDHVSPISDTTILASAGAQCHHINHVSTQIPYVLCVAACCFLGYLAAGITANGWVGTGVGFAALIVVLVILDRKNKGTKRGVKCIGSKRKFGSFTADFFRFIGGSGRIFRRCIGSSCGCFCRSRRLSASSL